MTRRKIQRIKTILFYTIIALGFPIVINLALTEQDNRQFAQEVTPVFLIPSTQKAEKGEELIVALQVKGKPVSVRGVQINLTYPHEKLSKPQINYNNSPFTVSIEEISSNGIIAIVRNAPVPVVDEKQIASIKFTALSDVTPQEIRLAPNSNATSGVDNTTLPLTFTVVDSSFYHAQANNGYLGPFLEFMDRILPPY